MELKPTYLGTMISLATIALGLVAAGAWNQAINALFIEFLPKKGGMISLFVYAIVVSLIAIFVVQSLAKLAERQSTPKTLE